MTDPTWAPPPPFLSHDVTTQLHGDGAYYATCSCGWHSVPCATAPAAAAAGSHHHLAVTPATPKKSNRIGWIAGGVGLFLVVAVAAAAGGAASDDDIVSDSAAEEMVADSYDETYGGLNLGDDPAELEWEFIAKTCENSLTVPEIRSALAMGVSEWELAEAFAEGYGGGLDISDSDVVDACVEGLSR